MLITIKLNNSDISVEENTTVAASILSSGVDAFRRSVSGEVRGPLCGMGVCFECRVTIDGVRHQRSCTTLVADGMEIITDE
ncbi:MAG: (2Fe-2S)-binding protein [Acidobacteria bacterium]|nr:(2Fe-2S)-binding protein [Acidobacteriota bacterium]